MVCVHPRGLANAIIPLRDAIEEGIDFWHGQYWNSANQMLESVVGLENIPKLLTHHNHHCLDKSDWREYSGLNEMTEWGCEKLRQKHEHVYKIPHGIDLDRFKYIDEYPPKHDVPTIGYVGRVVPWKNLDKICKAAKKLGYKVVGTGYVDKPDYWEKEIKQYVDDGTLDFVGGIGRSAMCPVNIKDELYSKMDVFCMYSTGEKESGTLPLLEAMASGVPVLATEQGMARDLISHNKNGIIFDDDTFETELSRVMKDVGLRKSLRKKGWNTVKHNSEQKMARDYAKTYYDIIWNGQPVVSVIIPTYNRFTKLIDTILSVDSDDYPAKEIIVIDDNSDDETKMACQKLKKEIKTPLLYLNTERDGYNLAMARNMGVVESLGSVLLFLDDRFELKGGLEHISQVPNGEWHWGKKIINGSASTKRSFIENFSWIKKKDFVAGGMFNERITCYGGMSQITREQYNGKVEFIYDEDATAIEHLRARGDKRKDIWKAKEIIAKLNT